jgi:glucitol operon activator protein
MDNVTFFLLMFAAMSLTGVSALAQHKYYARTVRRLAREHDEPGCVLVSGRGRSRFRGAIAVLVLRKHDEVIRAAAVMEGASVLARFKEQPDWVGLSARGPLPECSASVSVAVAEARSRVPGRQTAQAPHMRSVAPRRSRQVKAHR